MEYVSVPPKAEATGSNPVGCATFPRRNLQERAPNKSASRVQSPYNEHGRHLYFIKMAGSRPVKIGRGSKPEVRVGTLQVASPYKLTLLGFLEDCGDYEFAFHRHLSEYQLMGEWFSWSRKVEATVKLALSGGDWKAEIAEKPRVSVTGDEWWVDSKLYEDRHARR